MTETIDGGAVTTVPPLNPLLTRLNKLPGTTVRLPSRGLFYTNGELDSDCVEGEVVMYAMTTSDELIMRSSDMLFQGTAIESVLKHCVPQILKPLELLVGDIDYLLTQLRRISYGKFLPIMYECSCAKDITETKKRKAAGETEYLIPMEHFIQNTKELDLKDFNSQYKVELENGQQVVLRPLRLCDFVKIQQLHSNEALKNIDNLREFVAENFTAVTKSVDGIEDYRCIREWYEKLPRLDTEKIKRKLDSMSPWGIEFTYTIKCKHCGEEKELTTHLNPVYFFTLPSSPETVS